MELVFVCEVCCVKMSFSLKQLDQRYENICRSIEDAKDHTLQHLTTGIQLDLTTFFNHLGNANLGDCTTKMDGTEET